MKLLHHNMVFGVTCHLLVSREELGVFCIDNIKLLEPSRFPSLNIYQNTALLTLKCLKWKPSHIRTSTLA